MAKNQHIELFYENLTNLMTREELDRSDGSVQAISVRHNWKDGCRCQECFSKTRQQWTVEPVPATVCALCSTEITKWSPTDFCKECEVITLEVEA